MGATAYREIFGLQYSEYTSFTVHVHLMMQRAATCSEEQHLVGISPCRVQFHTLKCDIISYRFVIGSGNLSPSKSLKAMCVLRTVPDNSLLQSIVSYVFYVCFSTIVVNPFHGSCFCVHFFSCKVHWDYVGL